MKIKTLKLEENYKIKFNLKIEFDEIEITLFHAGIETKFKEKMRVDNYNEKLYEKVIFIIEKLYKEYIKAKEIEEKIIETFEDKNVIEFLK